MAKRKRKLGAQDWIDGNVWSFPALSTARDVYQVIIEKPEFLAAANDYHILTVLDGSGGMLVLLRTPEADPEILASVKRLALLANGEELNDEEKKEVQRQAAVRWRAQRGEQGQGQPIGMMSLHYPKGKPLLDLSDDLRTSKDSDQDYTWYIFRFSYTDRSTLREFIRDANSRFDDGSLTGLAAYVKNTPPREVFVSCSFRHETPDSKVWCEQHKDRIAREVTREDLIDGIKRRQFNVMTFTKEISARKVYQLFK